MVERPPKPPDRPASPRFKIKRGTPKPAPQTLRDLLRKQPSREQWSQVWSEIKTEAPRGAAIVSAAVVQSALIFALRQRFWEEPPFDIDTLLEPPGPLSSFYGCIEIGFALGMYGPVIYNDLHTIRRIRNGFAHAMVPLNFDTPEVVLELEQLQFLKWVRSFPAEPFDESHTPGSMELIRHEMIPTSTNREKYAVTCELLWERILMWGGGDVKNKATKPLLP